MVSMNDSGYCSSPKHANMAVEETTHFFMKTKNSNPTPSKIVAGNGETIGRVASRKVPQMKVNNTIFLAKLRGHDGKKFWVHFSLPCCYIQEKTEVEWEEISGKVYDYIINLQDTKPYSKPQSELTEPSGCKLFFVSLNRKHKTTITHVDHKKVGRGVDMCVNASPHQTFEEAFIKDGRFKNVERFNLNEKVEGGLGPDVDIVEDRPADVPEEVVLEVKVGTAVQSTDDKCSTPLHESMASTSTVESTSDVDTAEKSVSETSRKKPQKNFNELTGRLWEENAVYVFSKDGDELTKQERMSERERCLRARAWCTLVGPKDRGAKKYEKSLENLATSLFANHNVVSRPVRFTKTLHELYDSIGVLKCGSVTATCFLVSDNMIATNFHVVEKIETARRSSTPDDHSEVYVHFDYETNGQPLLNGRKLMPLSYEGNKTYRELDYAFLFLEEGSEEQNGEESEELYEVESEEENAEESEAENEEESEEEYKEESEEEKLTTLGQFVRCNVPEQGVVCIVGHPGDKEKQDELCPVLPLHDDRRSLELERRFAENEMNCRNNQSGCINGPFRLALAYLGRKCVHSHQPGLEQICGEDSVLTYDVGSFFEGCSGAPVFDMKCNIVALHTGGFRLPGTSIVEYGINFEAIIRHLLTTGYSEFVREHFPYCGFQDMEIEDIEMMETE